MKLLNVITSGINREGITTTQLEYFGAMDKTDMQVDMASVGNSNPEVFALFEAMNMRVIQLPKRNKHVIKYIFALWKLMRKEHYDVVHVHGSSCLMSIELLIAKLCGIKIRVAHSRNTMCDQLKAHRLLRPVFDRSYNVAFACGQEAGEWLFQGKPFTIIRNGKDMDKYRFNEKIRNRIRTAYGINDEKVFGFVGNLNEQKNPEYLLEIFREIYRLNQNTRFFVIGDGAKRQDLERYANELGIGGALTFTGRIANVNELLQAMDVMLLTSRWEGLPNVVIEWQACGLPSLVSDCVTKECAVTELVQFLSIEEQPVVWAERALQQDMSQRKNRSGMVQRKLAEAGYDIRENAKAMRERYFSLVANPEIR